MTITRVIDPFKEYDESAMEKLPYSDLPLHGKNVQRHQPSAPKEVNPVIQHQILRYKSGMKRHGVTIYNIHTGESGSVLGVIRSKHNRMRPVYQLRAGEWMVLK